MIKKIFLSVIVIVCSVCFLTACGEKNSMTGWELELKESGEYVAVDYAIVSLALPTESTAENKYIKGVCINADPIKDTQEIMIKLIFASTSSIKNSHVINSSMKEENVKLDFKDEKDGWVDLMPQFSGYGTTNYNYSYVKFEVVGNVKINEIVFLTSADEKFVVTIEEQGIYPDGAINSSKEYNLSQLQAMKESGEMENSVINVFDEQEKFDYSKFVG